MLRKIFSKGAIWVLLLVACTVIISGCVRGKKNTKVSYVVGIDPTWSPLELAGKGKNLDAFMRELLTIVAKEQGVSLSFVPRALSNLILDLEKKEYDVMLTTLLPHQFYKDQLFFSSSFFDTGPVLVVRSTFKETQAMSGKLVAVSTSAQEVLVVQYYPGAMVKFYHKIPLALDEVILDNIDGALVNTVLAHAYVADFFSEQLKIGSKPLGKAGIRLVSRKGEYVAFIESMQHGVKKAKKGGLYKKLLNKWGLMPNA